MTTPIRPNDRATLTTGPVAGTVTQNSIGGVQQQRPTTLWATAANSGKTVAAKTWVRPQNIFTFDFLKTQVPWLTRRTESRLDQTAAMRLGEGDTLSISSVLCPTETVQLRIPQGVDAHMVGTRYLVLVNTRGDFNAGEGSDNVSNALLSAFMDETPAIKKNTPFDPCLVLEVQAYQPDKGEPFYAINVDRLVGDMSSSKGARNLQEAIDDFAAGLYRSEFDARSSELTLAGGKLCVGGPNRDGGFELSSGRSSMIVRRDGTLQLGKRWENSTVYATDMERGAIFIDMKLRDGVVRWRCDLNFGNTDPKQCYVGRVVSNTSSEQIDDSIWYRGSPAAAKGFAEPGS